jgi:lysozyme
MTLKDIQRHLGVTPDGVLGPKTLAAIGKGLGMETDGWLDHAVRIIQEFEGLHKVRPDGRIEAYPDPGSGGDPWTIGWGSTGKGIERGTIWTREQAEQRFREDVGVFGAGVKSLLNGTPTTDQQMAALVSLAYNIGLGAFSRSTVLRRHLAGAYDAAADAFGAWNKAAGRVLPGLTRRRAAEAALYRSGS